MDVFEFLKFVPWPVVFFLFVVTAVLGTLIFSFLKKRSKAGEEKPSGAVSPLASQEQVPLPETTPLSKKVVSENFLLILTILLLISSVPLAIWLIKQRKEVGKTKTREDLSKISLSPAPTITPETKMTPSSNKLPSLSESVCKRIKIYDEAWVEIPYEELSQLSFGKTIRIAVKAGEEGKYDKGRIRINSMEWTPENETTSQKPDSPGEFYIECEVGTINEKATICGISATPKNEFKIEAEVHNTITNEWR